MATTVETPVVLPATEEKSYDTIVVLSTHSNLNPTTMKMRYSARVGLGRALESGGYEILKSSIKNITIKDMFTEGTEAEIALTMSVVDTLKLRYEAE